MRDLPISYIDRRMITGQAIVNGRLVTEFRQSLFRDGSEMHPAGTIVCDAVTDKQKDELDSDVLMGETVTRLNVLFWDRGQFTPRFNA